MDRESFIIKNIASFKDNNIGDYIKRYIKNDCFYNFGWGNLNEKMIKFKVPTIGFNKNTIGYYGNSDGMNSLIDEITKFINKKSDVKVKKENILITNGATNAIFLLSYFFKNFLGINKVLLQSPSYDTAINIFKSQDYDIKTVDPCFNKIENEDFELAYLMFKFQNPTGIYIKKDKAIEFKNKLLKKCYLIEDDSYGLLEADSEINIINNKKYLYVSSFSKYIFPGLRMGHVVAHKEIIGRLKIIQKYYNSHPNPLSQSILLDYLKTDKIYDEIEHKNNILGSKRKLFEESLSPKIKDLVQYNRGGFYYWFKFPKSIDLKKLFIELLKNKILIIPGDIYFIDDKYSAMRVSVSSINSNDISIATKQLSHVIEKYDKQNFSNIIKANDWLVLSLKLGYFIIYDKRDFFKNKIENQYKKIKAKKIAPLGWYIKNNLPNINLINHLYKLSGKYLKGSEAVFREEIYDIANILLLNSVHCYLSALMLKKNIFITKGEMVQCFIKNYDLKSKDIVREKLLEVEQVCGQVEKMSFNFDSDGNMKYIENKKYLKKFYANKVKVFARLKISLNK